MLAALLEHRAHVARTLDPAQAEAAARRDAELLGLDSRSWKEIRARHPDLVLFRELHALVSSTTTVRRADRDGQWALATARPGHLRSRPQSFRAADRVEPAWDHNTLASRVSDVIASASTATASDVMARVAVLVWTLVRAQPFLGDNERVALAIASLIFARLELPVFSLDEVATNDNFLAALAAETSEPLATYLRRTLWDQELQFAEWLHSLPSGDERWSLAAEHARAAIRDRGRHVGHEQLVQLVGHVVVHLTQELAGGDSGAVRRTQTGTHAERLRVAIASARRGRHLCPQRHIHEVRIRINDVGLDAVVVAGSAGRGLTGAAGLHIAFEIADVAPATGRASPGLLLVHAERLADQQSRFAEWSPLAIQRAWRDSPIRGCSPPTRRAER